MTFFTGTLALGTGTTTFVEQTGTGYARQSITLQQAVAGSNRRITNAASVTFTASAAWSNISTQMAFFPSPDSSANPLVWWTLDFPVPALASGGTKVIGAGAMNLMLTDVAAASGLGSSWVVGDMIGTTGGNSTLNVGAPLLINDGVMSLGFPPGCIGHLKSANANSSSDQQFILNPAFAGVNFIVTKIVATNASASLTTAAGGIYPAASKGGAALVASSQAYSTLTAATLYESLTLATVTNTAVYNSAPYLSLTTAQGTAATVDVYIFGNAVY